MNDAEIILGEREAARRHRMAIAQTLVELGLLSVAWWSIPLPFGPPETVNVPSEHGFNMKHAFARAEVDANE